MLKRKFPCFPFKRRDCMETICHKSGNIRSYQLAGTGRLAQRIVLNTAVAATTLVAGIAATTVGNAFTPLFPEYIGIYHGTGSRPLLRSTSGMKRTRTPLICEAVTSLAVATPFLVEEAV